MSNLYEVGSQDLGSTFCVADKGIESEVPRREHREQSLDEGGANGSGE